MMNQKKRFDQSNQKNDSINRIKKRFDQSNQLFLYRNHQDEHLNLLQGITRRCLN
jgi:hypothetical protein